MSTLDSPAPFLPARRCDAQELSRRKSLLAWEDGEGAASDPSDSPVRGGSGLGATAAQDEEEHHLSTGYVIGQGPQGPLTLAALGFV